MTSKLTREQVVALIAEHSYDSALVDALEYLLAAMDSEPVYQVFDPSDGRWVDVDDEEEMIRLRSIGGETRTLYTAPPSTVVDSEPVAWEVKGILCHTLEEASKYVGVPEPLYAYPRLESVSAEPVAYMYDGEDGVEYNGHNEFSGGGKGIPLYRHAQPEPKVPVVTAGDFPSFIKYDITDVDEAWSRGFNTCRAAMLQEDEKSAGAANNCRSCENVQDLQAGNSPAHSGLRPEQSGVSPAQGGNPPAQNQGWIPVSERLPEREVDVQVYCTETKEQMVAYLERKEREGYFRFATWRTGDGIYCQPTHWMPLPAAPQEEPDGK